MTAPIAIPMPIEPAARPIRAPIPTQSASTPRSRPLAPSGSNEVRFATSKRGHLGRGQLTTDTGLRDTTNRMFIEKTAILRPTLFTASRGATACLPPPLSIRWIVLRVARQTCLVSQMFDAVQRHASAQVTTDSSQSRAATRFGARLGRFGLRGALRPPAARFPSPVCDRS